MRFQEVKQSTTGHHVVTLCYRCQTRLDGARHRIYADLDGAAFEAYYCERCYQATEILKPYRFSFIDGGKRHVWIRYSRSIEACMAAGKYDALFEYPKAHAWCIEDSQGNDPDILRSWGLKITGGNDGTD